MLMEVTTTGSEEYALHYKMRFEHWNEPHSNCQHVESLNQAVSTLMHIKNANVYKYILLLKAGP